MSFVDNDHFNYRDILFQKTQTTLMADNTASFSQVKVDSNLGDLKVMIIIVALLVLYIQSEKVAEKLFKYTISE